jgi:hypothetical protein
MEPRSLELARSSRSSSGRRSPAPARGASVNAGWLAPLQAYSLTAVWLLVGAMSGCFKASEPPAQPPPAPAERAPAASPAQRLPQPRPQAPQPPTVAPSPASVPGRLKIALYSSWLWIDGQYLSPLAKLDYLGLFSRLRDRRAASAGSIEARTFELEMDATSDGRSLQDVLDLVEDADYERVELVTSTGRSSLCTGRCSGNGRRPGSSNGRQTAVLLRRDGISVWSGQIVPGDAVGAPDPKLEKLLEIPQGGSDDDFEAAVRRVCSRAGRCSRVVLHFEEDLPGRELLRVLERLDRAAAGGRSTPPVISLSPFPPPPLGEEISVFEETSAFEAPSTGSGRLPPVVIRQVVRASYGAFRRCYERGLVTSPKLEGRVTVRFVIDQDGRVGHVANDGSDLPSDDVVNCVLQGFRAIHFPPPKGGTVTVHYPILLVTR